MNEKTALVTGADGGLGIHVTKALLDAGFLVVGLAPKIKQSNFDSHRFTALPARLDSLEAAKQSADAVMTKFGKIDVVAHLVGGFAGARRHPIECARRIRIPDARGDVRLSLAGYVQLSSRKSG